MTKEKEVKKCKKVKKLEQRLSGVMYQKLAAEMELHTCDNEFQVEDDSQSVCPESAVDATSKRSMDLVSDFSEMPPLSYYSDESDRTLEDNDDDDKSVIENAPPKKYILQEIQYTPPASVLNLVNTKSSTLPVTLKPKPKSTLAPMTFVPEMFIT